MDIRDCLKHPFKIECPAELVSEDPADQWAFVFDNGYSVLLLANGDGQWSFMAVDEARNEAHTVELHMTDDNSDITNLLDRIARLRGTNDLPT